MTEITDVTVLDGAWSSDKPCVIIEAATAREAIRLGELENLVGSALDALALSGNQIVYVVEEQS